MDSNLARGYYHLPDETAEERARSTSRQTGPSPPSDRCNAVYLALVLCGAGFLLPYNSFITAVDHYQAKYPGSTIIFDMSLTYICLAFVGVLLNNFFVEMLSLHCRITFGYLLSFTMLLLVAVCDVWLELLPASVSYRVTLVAIAVVALGCTVQQSSFYGYTSMLPPRYTQAVMTGESAAGLIVSVNRIVTKAMVHDAHVNTIIFFAISVVALVVCCVVFQLSQRSQVVHFYVSRCQSASVPEDQRNIVRQMSANPEEVSLVDILDGNITRDHYGVLVLQSPNGDNDRTLTDDSHVIAERARRADDTTRQNESHIHFRGQTFWSHLNVWDSIKAGCRSRYKVAVNIWPYMLSIGFAYFVTLCLFPGIEAEVISCRLNSWMPVLLIAVFNLFDFIGKIIASIPYDWSRGRLVACTMSRIIIVPLLMLCAAPRSNPVLQDEGWSLIFSLLLGITNGYFGSVPMIIAPSKVPDAHKELTGNIMTLSYSVGLTAGSVSAYILDSWMGSHAIQNPCLPLNDTTTDYHINDMIVSLHGNHSFANAQYVFT